MRHVEEAQKALAIALPALCVWLLGLRALGVVAVWLAVTLGLIPILALLFEVEGEPKHRKFAVCALASLASAIVTALLF